MGFFATVFILAATIPPLPFCADAVTQDQRWKDIVVLRSTRSDVEKIMGKAAERAHIANYPLKDGNLQIEYSDGLCEPGQYRAWKVAEGTVIEIVYTPFENPIKFSSFNLDLTKFRIARESPDVPDMITYIKDDEGIAYTVEPDGTLHDITYFPPSRYENIRCSKLKMTAEPKKPSHNQDYRKEKEGANPAKDFARSTFNWVQYAPVSA